MASYQVAVTNENDRPLSQVTVEAVSLDSWPTVSATAITGDNGVASFSGLDGAHWFRPLHTRVSSTVGDRIYTGQVKLQVIDISLGAHPCIDYVVETGGSGTHTTLAAAVAAAITAQTNATIFICDDLSEQDIEVGGMGDSQSITIMSWQNRWRTITSTSSDMFTQTSGGGGGSGADNAGLFFKNIGLVVDTATKAIYFLDGGTTIEIRNLSFDHCLFNGGYLVRNNDSLDALGNMIITANKCVGALIGFYQNEGSTPPDELIATDNDLSLTHWWKELAAGAEGAGTNASDFSYVVGGSYVVTEFITIQAHGNWDSWVFKDFLLQTGCSGAHFRHSATDTNHNGAHYSNLRFHATAADTDFGDFQGPNTNVQHNLFITNIHGVVANGVTPTGTFLTVDSDQDDPYVANIWAPDWPTVYSGPAITPPVPPVVDHGALTGLSDDDHNIYALLAGRSGGQTLIMSDLDDSDKFLIKWVSTDLAQIQFDTGDYMEFNQTLNSLVFYVGSVQKYSYDGASDEMRYDVVSRYRATAGASGTIVADTRDAGAGSSARIDIISDDADAGVAWFRKSVTDTRLKWSLGTPSTVEQDPDLVLYRWSGAGGAESAIEAMRWSASSMIMTLDSRGIGGDAYFDLKALDEAAGVRFYRQSATDTRLKAEITLEDGGVDQDPDLVFYTYAGAVGAEAATESMRLISGGIQLDGDSNFHLQIVGSDPRITFDTDDYIEYVRATDRINFITGSGALSMATGEMRYQISSVTKFVVGTSLAEFGEDGSAPALQLHAIDGTNEGGELRIQGAAAYDNWVYDNYQGTLRWYTGSTVHMRLQGGASPSLQVFGTIESLGSIIRISDKDEQVKQQGDANIGPSQDTITTEEQNARKVVGLEASRYKLISAHGRALTGTAQVRYALYDDNDGVPGNLIGYTATITVTTTDQWWPATFAFDEGGNDISFIGSVTVETAGTYWISIHSDGDVDNLEWDFTAGGVSYEGNADAFSGGPEATWSGGSLGTKGYSLYIQGAPLINIYADRLGTGDEEFYYETSQGNVVGPLGRTLWDADRDTGIQVEESADEDIIRFDTGGVERMALDPTGLAIDSIVEKTGDAGVTIDGLLIKDISAGAEEANTTPSNIQTTWANKTGTARKALLWDDANSKPSWGYVNAVDIKNPSSISSFSDGLSSTYEIDNGGTRSPSFLLTYEGTPSACSISMDAQMETDLEVAGGDYPQALTGDFGVTAEAGAAINNATTAVMINRTYTWTATATVDGTAGLTKTTTLKWLNRKYYGPSTQASTLTTAQVLALDADGDGGSALDADYKGAWTVNADQAGEYIWFAFRDQKQTDDGNPTFTVGGFPGGFTDKGTVSHTNDSGFVETFRLWRSDNVQLGSTEVTVT